MFKSMKRNLLALVAGVVTMVAMTGVSTACAWGVYEPEIPESIRKEL
ncbi:MAG: cyclic lactone autoinducer peptide [Marinisporobacter sp.]|jgi:cyclic lactone autoinducer peptide|nr:cyclic lactone autoinducer peptide [Marinisporobacter sp.]